MIKISHVSVILQKAFVIMIFPFFVVWSTPSLGFSEVDLAAVKKTHKCPDCDLSGADLSGVQLRMGTLSGADLSNANLSGAMFLRMDLTNVNFSNANLEDTSWSNSDIAGAIFDGAKWSPKYYEELQLARNVPDGVLPEKKLSPEQLKTELKLCKDKLEDRDNKYSQCRQQNTNDIAEINQLRQTINKNSGKVGGYDQVLQRYEELLVLYEEEKKKHEALQEAIRNSENASSGSHVPKLGQTVGTSGGECVPASAGTSGVGQAQTEMSKGCLSEEPIWSPEEEGPEFAVQMLAQVSIHMEVMEACANSAVMSQAQLNLAKETASDTESLLICDGFFSRDELPNKRQEALRLPEMATALPVLRSRFASMGLDHLDDKRMCKEALEFFLLFKTQYDQIKAHSDG